MFYFVIYPLVKTQNKSKYKSYLIQNIGMSCLECTSLVVSYHTIYDVKTDAASFKVVSTAILLNPSSFLIYTL